MRFIHRVDGRTHAPELVVVVAPILSVEASVAAEGKHPRGCDLLGGNGLVENQPEARGRAVAGRGGVVEERSLEVLQPEVRVDHRRADHEEADHTELGRGDDDALQNVRQEGAPVEDVEQQ